MNYTHYGNAGIPFALVKEYNNYDEMVSSFKLGPGYLDVRYGEYVIISSEDLDHGGEIYRREYNFKNNMGGAKFITNMNQGQREWAEEAKKQAERAQEAADSAEEIAEIAYDLAETIINNELERIEAEQQRVADFQEMEEIFTDLQGIQVSEEEPTSEKVGAWIKEGTEEERFLLENTDIAQKLGQDKNKVTSQKLVNDTIEPIDAKIENIEAELAVNSIVDADFAQEKVVPENALPRAQITEIGGMTYKCNNLIPFPYQNKDGTVSSNITFKINSDNSVTVSGTTDSESYAGFQLADSSTFFFENGKTYNLQGTVSGFCWVYISYRDKNNTERWIMGTGSSFVWNKEWTFQRLYLQVPPNTTINNITVYPMLNEGETALPYEPYFTGLRDSKVTEVESVGVNIWDEQYRSGYYSPIDAKFYASSNEICTANKIAVEAGKHYRMTLGNVQNAITIVVYDKKGAYLCYLNRSSSHIIIPPTNAAYITINFGKDYGAIYNNDIMFNEGDTVLPYAPYVEDTLAIPQEVQNLEGYGQGINEEYYNKIVLNSADNVKKFERKTEELVLTGTETKWRLNAYANATYGLKVYEIPHSKQLKTDFLCTHFDVAKWGAVSLATAKNLAIIDVADFNFITDGVQSLEEWKAYLAEQYAAGTPVTVEYALAEPIETDITDLFPDSNFIGAESGGTITAINEYGYDVPFTVEYKEKKNILSAEELEEKIAQELGDSEEKVLSQKAATREFRKIVAVKYAKTGWYVKSIPHCLTYDGLLLETDGVYCLNVPVNAGETYLVETEQISASMALWAVFDVGENIIAQDTTKYVGLQSANANVTIPDGGAMLRVYGYYNQNISCKKEVTIIPSPLTDKKWVAYGDSLTDPATLKEFKNYVDFITLETACIPINLGKGGSGFLKNQKYYGRVSAIPEDTDVITVFGSFNDYSFIADGNLGTADDDGSVETPTTLGAAMNKFLLELYARCPYVKIGFISPICWTWNNPYGGDRKENSEAYVALLEAVAKKWSIPYLDLFHTANIRLWDSETSKKYTINNDGTHLTEEGHKAFIYKKVKNFLETIC